MPESFLSEIQHNDPDLADTYTSPFPAIVFTKEGHLLGFGTVLGVVELVGQIVIEIEDRASPTGKVHILDFECLWNASTPDVVAKYGSQEIISAHEYFQVIDQLVQVRAQNQNPN